MISELKIRNFKSLESVDLKLGHFNLLVGANASGKSNFLDALRFLQGIANRLTLDEVLNGKPQTTKTVKWEGIRGGSRLVAFRAQDGTASPVFSFEAAQPTLAGDSSLTYTLEAAPIVGKLIQESIAIRGGRRWPESLTGVFPSNYESSLIPMLVELARMGSITLAVDKEMTKTGGTWTAVEQELSEDEARQERRLKLEEQRPRFDKIRALWDSYMDQMPALFSQFRIAAGVIEDSGFQSLTDEGSRIFDLLGDIQSIDPRPDLLRKYSKSGTVSRLDESGEGLAGLVQRINETPETKAALLEWLKELRPDEIDDLLTIKGAVDDFMVAVQEGNKQFPAEVLSD